MTDPADTAGQDFKDRMKERASMRDEARADADRTEAAIERLGPSLTPEKLQTFAQAAKARLRAEDGSYRREHMRAVAQRVEALSTKEIKIMGNRTDLLRTLVASTGETQPFSKFAVSNRNGAPGTIRTSDPQIRS